MINVTLADPEHNLRPRLTVMGIGGAGGNAINNMIRSGLEGCDFVGANTDSQALSLSLAPRKIQLGINMSRGLGAGSKPDLGRAAAEEQIPDILACLEGSDMLFITAGMGGGTGTGAAPVVARAAREAGILTVGVVTKPFHFEGNNRMRQAEYGINELQQYVDTLIVIPNQNLFRIANERTTFAEAFRLADEVLHSGVRGITDLMVMPGFMNLDFADVKTVMGEMGKAMMGTGEADGDQRAVRAAEAAISNPLLDDVSMRGARGVLINITGGMDMTLFEVDQAASRIREEVDPEAQIKVGSTLSDSLEGKIRVSVIATGIEANEVKATRAGTGSGGGQVRPVPAKIAIVNTRESGQAAASVSASSASPSSVMGAIQPTASPAAKTASSSNYFTMPQAMAPHHSAPPQYASKPGATAKATPAQQQASQAEQQVETPAAAEWTEAPIQHQAPQPAPAVIETKSTPAVEQVAPRMTPSTSGYSPRPATPPSQQASRGAQASSAPGDMRVTQIVSPAQQHAADQKRSRRSESLFTRITGFGFVRPSAQQEEEEDQLAHEEAIAAQTRLGIDPSDRPTLSSDQSPDLLDIPTFLRRQTNH